MHQQNRVGLQSERRVSPLRASRHEAWKDVWTGWDRRDLSRGACPVLAVQLHRRMLSTRMSSTRDYDSVLSRRPRGFEYQTDACDAHANELSTAFHLPRFGSYLVPRSKVASEQQRYDPQVDNRKM
jgi:hypothetical protein